MTLAFSLADVPFIQHLVTSPTFWLVTAFQFWMLFDAIRRKEWLWVVFMLLMPGFATAWYFITVFWYGPSATGGFELPGAYDRRRIKELQTQIHHLDKAHHYSQLADIYFQQGKFDQAEASYRSALERDPQDLDTRAHLGQCLLRQKRPAEALPHFEAAVKQLPSSALAHHNLASTLATLGRVPEAIGEEENALRLDPALTAARENLARLRQR